MPMCNNLRMLLVLISLTLYVSAFVVLGRAVDSYDKYGERDEASLDRHIFTQDFS